MLGTDVKALLLIPQQTLREEKDRAEARQGELLKRHESERKELEAAFDQLQAKFYQLSELAETSKVR
jgi:anti-sigma factor ChrR (cupin superfamily)